MNKEFYLEKLASSLDAVRKKQYWQMLKRLYGGTENALKHLSESRDIGIYHGTRENALADIAKEGLKPGRFREFGKGVFFGDKEIAGLYSHPKMYDARYLKNLKPGEQPSTGGYGYVDDKVTGKGFRPDSASLERLEQFVKDNPEYALLKGKNVRLAKPDELKGTKLKYPKTDKAMVFDIDPKKGFKSVGGQLNYLYDTEPALRLRKMYQKKLDGKPLEELQKMYDDLTGEKGQFPLSEGLAKTYTAQEMIKKLVDSRFTPKNLKEFNQMKYFGQSKRGRIFKRLTGRDTRNEFFIKDNVPVELLRTESGDALKPISKPKFDASKYVVKPKNIQLPAEIHTPDDQKNNVARISALTAGIGAGSGYVLYKFLKRKKDAK